METVWQVIAGVGINAVDDDSASSAALTADVVVADNRGHFWLQKRMFESPLRGFQG
ncbi:hypothetical protein D9M73_295420 [compost metagenome]